MPLQIKGHAQPLLIMHQLICDRFDTRSGRLNLIKLFIEKGIITSSLDSCLKHGDRVHHGGPLSAQGIGLLFSHLGITNFPQAGLYF